MTAYARSVFANEFGNGSIEIRSVNQRYLEVFIRLPDQLRGLEPILRDKLRTKLSRGKVECQLRLDLDPAKNVESMLFNQTAAMQLLKAVDWIKEKSPEGVINLTDLLRFPGVMNSAEMNLDELTKNILIQFDTTLTDFIKVREREGNALKNILLQRIDGITAQVQLIQIHIPQVIAQQKQKLIDRYNEIQLELESNRVEQEIVLLLQRLDIQEELDRLSTHLIEAKRILNQKDAVVGRRLDFLMQEFNRETNTIASKSVNSDITNATIEMKVLIEQMREQIQNIE